jgi:lysophospholipase L1-like esterase
MKKAITIILLGFIVFIGFWHFLSVPEIKNTNPTGKNIICFGDSLTYGTGTTKKGMDYPSQLSRMINMPVINAGVPGDTTASALERLEKDVLSRSPRIVLITLGGNDLKNRVPRETTFKNLRTIVESIQDTGALVIVAGIDIPIWGRGFGNSYEELCDELGAVLIPNIFKGIMGKRRLMSDPIHPNDDGYALFAEKFYEKIIPYLQ